MIFALSRSGTSENNPPPRNCDRRHPPHPPPRVKSSAISFRPGLPGGFVVVVVVTRRGIIAVPGPGTIPSRVLRRSLLTLATTATGTLRWRCPRLRATLRVLGGILRRRNLRIRRNFYDASPRHRSPRTIYRRRNTPLLLPSDRSPPLEGGLSRTSDTTDDPASGRP